jgi:hypothetical protein
MFYHCHSFFLPEIYLFYITSTQVADIYTVIKLKVETRKGEKTK